MFRLEERIIRFLEKYAMVLFFLVVSLLGVVARWSGRNMMTGDMEWFLVPWYIHFQASGGLVGLREQVGDYGVPYQFILALLSYLPYNNMYMIKLVSAGFDYLIAFAAAGGVYLLTQGSAEKRMERGLIGYSIVLFLPTVVLNSAFWGQCDGIYSFFALISLLLLVKKRFFAAFLFLGFSFAFKLQAVFLLPAYLYYYVSEKKFSLLNLLLIPVGMYLFNIPGFLYGRSLLEPIRLYLNQSNEWLGMSMNSASFWLFIAEPDVNAEMYELLHTAALLTTVCILGLMLLYQIRYPKPLSVDEVFLKLCVWSIWTCVLFLPAMHDRYSYLMDILLVMLCFRDRRMIPFAVVTVLVSLRLYAAYMFRLDVNYMVLAIVYIAAYCAFTALYLMKPVSEKQK